MAGLRHRVPLVVDREVDIHLDDLVLHGTLALPERAAGLVVFAHGSGSSRFSRRNREVAEALEGHGFATLLLDLLTKTDYRDFGKEVFPASVRSRKVQMYLFDGYWEDVGTIRSYYDACLSLAGPTPPFDLAAPGAEIVDVGAESSLANAARLDLRTALLLTLPTMLWAGNAVVGRAIAGQFPPIALNWVRWLSALVVLAPFVIVGMRRRGGWPRASWRGRPSPRG